MREILPGVFSWARHSEPHGYDFNGFLIRRPEGNLIIDPVEPDDSTRAAIVLGGARTIILTNRNHSRASNWVRERTGAVVHMHPADGDYARQQGAFVDVPLLPGRHLGPFRVVAAPGKSPGEIALYWDARRLLVVGDVVINPPDRGLTLLREQVMDDPAMLRRSVRGLAALCPTTLLCGDGAPLCEDAATKLSALVQSLPKES